MNDDACDDQAVKSGNERIDAELVMITPLTRPIMFDAKDARMALGTYWGHPASYRT
jgi:hypothetical protein